jgi:hypothetical protein
MNCLDEILTFVKKLSILLAFRPDLKFCLLNTYLTLNELEKVHIHNLKPGFHFETRCDRTIPAIDIPNHA